MNELKVNHLLPNPYIHSDVYATMTGFTRFMHEHDEISGSWYGWKYNKTENMPDSEYQVYTHLVTDRTNYTGFTIYKDHPFKQFFKLDIAGFLRNPLKNPLILLEDKVFILERDDIYALRTGQETY